MLARLGLLLLLPLLLPMVMIILPLTFLLSSAAMASGTWSSGYLQQCHGSSGTSTHGTCACSIQAARLVKGVVHPGPQPTALGFLLNLHRWRAGKSNNLLDVKRVQHCNLSSRHAAGLRLCMLVMPRPYCLWQLRHRTQHRMPEQVWESHAVPRTRQAVGFNACRVWPKP